MTMESTCGCDAAFFFRSYQSLIHYSACFDHRLLCFPPLPAPNVDNLFLRPPPLVKVGKQRMWSQSCASQARHPSVVNSGARLDDARSPYRTTIGEKGSVHVAVKNGHSHTTFLRLRKRPTPPRPTHVCTRRGRNLQVSVTMRRIRTCSTGKDSGEGEGEQAEVKCRALLGAVQRGNRKKKNKKNTKSSYNGCVSFLLPIYGC